MLPVGVVASTGVVVEVASTCDAAVVVVSSDAAVVAAGSVVSSNTVIIIPSYALQMMLPLYQSPQ